MRATTTPLPPAPDQCSPVRITVKMARPLQFRITYHCYDEYHSGDFLSATHTSAGILSNRFPSPLFFSLSFETNPSIQKLRRILAALSASLSREVGQKVSAPNFCVALLTGTPTLSNHSLLDFFVFSQIEDVVWGCWEEDILSGGL